MSVENHEELTERETMLDFIDSYPDCDLTEYLIHEDYREVLSSGEAALAAILTVLRDRADALDGVQLAAVSETLMNYTQHVVNRETAALRKLGGS